VRTGFGVYSRATYLVKRPRHTLPDSSTCERDASATIDGSTAAELGGNAESTFADILAPKKRAIKALSKSNFTDTAPDPWLGLPYKSELRRAKDLASPAMRPNLGSLKGPTQGTHQLVRATPREKRPEGAPAGWPAPPCKPE
jgi:hypothetical protein